MSPDTITRQPADAVTQITGIRLTPGDAPATLVNISESGLLAESAARFVVGGPVVVRFEGTLPQPDASGRVARSEVAVMLPDGTLRYHIAIEFDVPLRLEPAAAPRTAPARDTVRNRW